jgi:hypothetical protein
LSSTTSSDAVPSEREIKVYFCEFEVH